MYITWEDPSTPSFTAKHVVHGFFPADIGCRGFPARGEQWHTLGIKGERTKGRNTETVNNSREIIMLVMVEKSRAELETIYRRAMVWPIIADSPLRGRSRTGVETTDEGWTWLTTSVYLAVNSLFYVLLTKSTRLVSYVYSDAAQDSKRLPKEGSWIEFKGNWEYFKNEAKWSLHLVNCIFMTILSSYNCTCTCVRHEISTCNLYVTKWKWSSFRIPCHTIINIFVISV